MGAADPRDGGGSGRGFRTQLARQEFGGEFAERLPAAGSASSRRSRPLRTSQVQRGTCHDADAVGFAVTHLNSGPPPGSCGGASALELALPLWPARSSPRAGRWPGRGRRSCRGRVGAEHPGRVVAVWRATPTVPCGLAEAVEVVAVAVVEVAVEGLLLGEALGGVGADRGADVAEDRAACRGRPRRRRPRPSSRAPAAKSGVIQLKKAPS